MQRQTSLFESQRSTLNDAMSTAIDSIRAYGERYQHWAIAYSGGKDSTALATLVPWAIRTGRLAPPESLTILYADTRMELPPLRAGAMRLMEALRNDGFNAQVVLPEMQDRFFVYVLGLGVPPPSNTFRWCTPKIKIEPMQAALADLRDQTGEKLLMLTGVRMGESEARDARIAVSCSKDSGECGQGWMQVSTPEALADTLAPLLNWRLCHVYDWLYFDTYGHGYGVDGIADVYGEDDVRTGCVGCNLASKDTALIRLLRNPAWSHLQPLMELKPLYAKLKMAKWRKRKVEAEQRKDGTWNKNVQRMGPLTMAGRKYGLERILDIQQRAGVDLINAEEEARIREMWRLDMWPQKWSAADANADVMIDALMNVGGDIVSQPLLVSND
jgi:DNA sulfur modification protein DndC